MAKTVQFCYSFYALHWVNMSHQINSSELSTSATTLHFHKRKHLSLKLLRGAIWIWLLWMGTLKMLWKHWKKPNPQSRRFCWAQGHMTPFLMHFVHFLQLIQTIVIIDDWLWKAANISDKNNSAAVYVQSTVKVHNPLFSVGKLLRNKLMQRFYWSIQSKW